MEGNDQVVPGNWPKTWATKRWNVHGVSVTGDDVIWVYREIAAGRGTPRSLRRRFLRESDECINRVLVLLRKPGFISWDKEVQAWTTVR